MRPLFLGVLAMVALLAQSQTAGAQLPATNTALPLDVLDSTFAVRLELERLADMIRQGTLDPRRMTDRDTESALRGLREVATGRKANLPAPGLGPLWDFGFQDIKLDAASSARIVVTARAALATDPEGSVDVTLGFVRQSDGRWKLDDHKGLRPFLVRQTGRFARGEAK